MDPSQIKAAFEERQKAVHELRALYDSAENRDLTAEEIEKQEKLDSAIKRYDEQIAAGLTAIEREKVAAEQRARYESLISQATTVPESKRTEVPSEEQRALTALATGEVKSAEFRDLTVGTGSAGGNLVPSTLNDFLYVGLRETATAIADDGARVIFTETGEAFSLPKVTTHMTAALVTEGSAIGENDPAFGLVTLNAYKFANLTQVSSELVNDSAIQIAEVLGLEAGEALGRAMGSYFISGTGTNQPNGIVNTSNANNVTTASGTAITADELIDVQHGVASPYRKGAVWVMKDSTLKVIRKLKDSNGQYLWQPGLSVGANDTLLGSPVLVDDNMDPIAVNNVTVVYGDLKRGYVVRMVRGVRVERSDDFAFNSDLVTFRFIVRADGDIRDDNAIVKLTQNSV